MTKSSSQARKILTAPPHAAPRRVPSAPRHPAAPAVSRSAPCLPTFTEIPGQAQQRSSSAPTHSSSTQPVTPTLSRPSAPKKPVAPPAHVQSPVRSTVLTAPQTSSEVTVAHHVLPTPKSVPEATPKQPVKPIAAIENDGSEDDEELVELKLAPLPELHSIEGNATVDDSEIQRLLDTGIGEAEVACRLNVTLARVFEVHKTAVLRRVTDSESSKRALVQDSNGHVAMPSPREVFAERIRDFSEVLDVAKQEYLNDPDSETNYNAMSSFMKTMKDLFQAYQDLEDPQDIAEQIIKQIVVPFMNALIKINIESFKSIMEDVAPAMANDFQKQQLNDGLKDALKRLRETTRTEYNRAVKTTASVFEVNLDGMLLKLQPVSGDFS